jgi:hypothetical protein
MEPLSGPFLPRDTRGEARKRTVADPRSVPRGSNCVVKLLLPCDVDFEHRADKVCRRRDVLVRVCTLLHFVSVILPGESRTFWRGVKCFAREEMTFHPRATLDARKGSQEVRSDLLRFRDREMKAAPTSASVTTDGCGARSVRCGRESAGARRSRTGDHAAQVQVVRDLQQQFRHGAGGRPAGFAGGLAAGSGRGGIHGNLVSGRRASVWPPLTSTPRAIVNFPTPAAAKRGERQELGCTRRPGDATVSAFPKERT